MKTIKIMSVAIMVLLAILASTAATPAGIPATLHKKSKAKSTSVKAQMGRNSCGVSTDQITLYLQNCPHHHTTYWVQDIPGTCNTMVGIENGRIVIVFVNDNGAIVGHSNSNGLTDSE